MDNKIPASVLRVIDSYMDLEATLTESGEVRVGSINNDETMDALQDELTECEEVERVEWSEADPDALLVSLLPARDSRYQEWDQSGIDLIKESVRLTF